MTDDEIRKLVDRVRNESVARDIIALFGSVLMIIVVLVGLGVVEKRVKNIEYKLGMPQAETKK